MSLDMARRNLRRFSAWRSLSVWASMRMSLVTPSTSLPTLVPNSRSISLLGGNRILDGVVQDAGGDGLVVELQVGQDAGDFDGVGEIGITRGAQLRAMRLHREHIGAVQQILVGIGIIGFDAFDEFILAEHEWIVVRAGIARNRLGQS